MSAVRFKPISAVCANREVARAANSRTKIVRFIGILEQKVEGGFWPPSVLRAILLVSLNQDDLDRTGRSRADLDCDRARGHASRFQLSTHVVSANRGE